MKLSDITSVARQIIMFVGKPELSGQETSDGEPYFVIKLKEPIMVRCSTEPEMPALEVEELFVRESLLDSDKWEGNETEGYTIPKFVADFSKNKEIPIFQETTIARWVKDNRKVKKEERKTSFLDKIRARTAKQ